MQRPKESVLSQSVRSLLAGGIAGGIAKTALAPLDRITILFQTRHIDFVHFTGTWRGIIDTLTHIRRTQGVLGLYRGHSLTLARVVPRAAVFYTIYDDVKRLLMPNKASETSFRRFLAGSLAGLSVMPFAYPLELVRVRMAIESKHSKVRPHLSTVFRTIYFEQGGSILSRLQRFYRGFAVSVAGNVPYRGGIFLVWETLNARAQERITPAFHAANKHKIHFVIGAMSGTAAQIATYPLEVVRRVQQASGAIHPERGIGILQTVGSIWRGGGLKGFYAGLGVGLVKLVPQTSISLAVWPAAKKILHVQ